MALVTIQRSPTPSTDPDLDAVDSSEDTSDGRSQLRKRSKTSKEKLKKIFSSIRFISKLRPCLSESYFTVKGAALILPHTECTKKSTKKSHGGEIQSHLQAMLHLLRPEDSIKIAVRLEDSCNYQRYMALVSTKGRQDTEEAVILGIDCTSTSASIGLVLPLWMGLKIKLGGDGGFSLCTDEQSYLFKPVSVQAMWSAIQNLYKVVRIAEDIKYLPEGLTHTWIGYYKSRIDNRDAVRMCLWNVEGVEVFAPSSLSIKGNESENERIKLGISQTLKEVMMTFDLDEVTSIMLRDAVEQKMGISLTDYKSYFDEEVMRIVGQMDKPSKILDFLYLGSEWNASNLDELIENGIGYILNVTKEIDNFFEGMFQYYNVRVYDVDESDLLKHWDKTYKFISKARTHDSKVLVHCKMGVSRSASTVMAFIMKDQRMTVDEAFKFVKKHRGCVHPNTGFMEQLRTYEGILTASNKRDIFRSKSEQNLLDEGSKEEAETSQGYFLGDSLFHMMSHTDWQTASESVACGEECIGSLQKDMDSLQKGDLYNLNFQHGDTDLEAAESRSADSTKEVPLDLQPSLTPETGATAITLQASSSSMASAALPIARPSIGALYSSKEMSQERESSTDIDSCVALSSSEGSSIQIRNSLGALVSRIKPDSSWIKMENEEQEKDDNSSGAMPIIDALQFDNSCSSSQPYLSAPGAVKTSGVLVSQCDVFKSVATTSGEFQPAPTGISVPGQLPISLSSNVCFKSLSPEKPAVCGFESTVQFYLGSNQNPLVVNSTVPAVVSSADAFSAPTTKLYSSQRNSSDLAALPGEQVALPEVQNADVKPTSMEQASHCYLPSQLQKDQQKELGEKTPKDKDATQEKHEADVKADGVEVAGPNSTPPKNQHRIEPGIRQYFREKIPWKPGKVKKMQEDINKTGHIIQDDDDEEDSSRIEDIKEEAVHQDVNDAEWALLEQTSEHQTDISLCQSHSCVELSSSGESGPLSLYEREEIPLTAGTVLRTRLEIEERQRLFWGDGDQELFGSTRPVLRTSSLKQERSTPRSRHTDNRRLTCGPVMSPGKSLNDLHSVGVSSESFFTNTSSTLRSSGKLEVSDEELSDDIQTMDGCHSFLHKSRLDEAPIEAGLVRKHTIELESKNEPDRTQFRDSLRSTSPITIRSSLSVQHSPFVQDSRRCFTTTDRDDTESIIRPDSLSSCTESWSQQVLHDDSDILIEDPAALMSLDSPEDLGIVEPCSNLVKYFVRKIEKQAVVSTTSRNVIPTDSDSKKATSPVKDETTKIKCSSVSECGIQGIAQHACLNAAASARTKPSDFFLSATAGCTAACVDFGSAAKDVVKDQEVTKSAGFDKNKLETAECGSSASSMMNSDLKMDTHTCLQPQVPSEALEDVKNISLSSPVSRVRDQVAALVEAAKPDPASNSRMPTHIDEHESPEPFVVKHLVDRFENKSPDSDRLSLESSHDFITKLKDLRDISISSPTASTRTETEEHVLLQPSVEDTTKLASATASHSFFRPIDNRLLQPCSSSVPCTYPVTYSSSSGSPTLSNLPLLSLHELPSETDNGSGRETSPGGATIISERKLGPVPFNRNIMESSEKKAWRSVRPKSAEYIHPEVLQRPNVIDSCITVDDDVSLRQVSDEGRKIRRLHIKSHPLNKLSEHSLGQGPFYSSM